MEFSGPPPSDIKREPVDQPEEGLLERIRDQAERQSRLILGELFGKDQEAEKEEPKPQPEPRRLRALSVLQTPEQRQPETRFMTNPDRGVAFIPRVERSTEAPEANQHAEAQLRPEVIMEQVAAAAEQDMPVEGALELRNERKDEPTSNQASTVGAASVGSILQDQQQYVQPSNVQSSSSVQPSVTPGQGFRYTDHTGYRSAIIKGFIVALTLIVLVFIAYLLS